MTERRELIPQGVKTTAFVVLKIYAVAALVAVGIGAFLTVLGVGL